jgi:hypothetical protein
MPARKQILGLFFHISLLFLAAMLAQRANYSKSQPELMRILYQNQQTNAALIIQIADSVHIDIGQICHRKRTYLPFWEASKKIAPIRDKFIAFIDEKLAEINQKTNTDFCAIASLSNENFNTARAELISTLEDIRNLDKYKLSVEHWKELLSEMPNDTIFCNNLYICKDMATILAAQKVRLANYALLSIQYLRDNVPMYGWSCSDAFSVLNTANRFIYLGDSIKGEINLGILDYTFFNATTDKGTLSSDKHKGIFKRMTYKNRPDKIGTQYYTITCIYEHHSDFRIVDTIRKTFSYEVLPAVYVQTKVLPTAPVPTLADLRGGDIAREKLRFPITLQSEDERKTVLSFTLWHLQKGKEPKPYKIKSDKIPAHILDKIQAGDQLQFVDIRGTEKRYLPTMAFIIH